MSFRKAVFHIIFGHLMMLMAGGAASAGERPAAIVNGAGITVAEYRQELGRALRARGVDQAKVAESELAVLKRDTLDGLIDRQLLYRESVNKGIKISETDVAAQMAALRKRFSTEKEYEEALASLNLDEESLRRQLTRGIAVQRFIDREFASRAKVSDGEVREYYEAHRDEFRTPRQVRVSHILIRLDDDISRERAEETMGKIRKRLAAGEEFAALAREFSQCLSRDRGGDLGYFSPGELKGELEKTVFSLPQNEVSGVVEDRFGLHLVKITGMKHEQVRSYEEASTQIREKLKRRQVAAEVARYVETLRKKAKLEVLLNEDGE